LKAQDDFENYVGDRLKRILGPRRLKRLKEKIKTNRAFAIRSSDFALATMSAPVAGSLSSLAAMAIYAEDPNMSPLFIQRRVGQDNEDFEIHKLRTLYADASQREFSGVPGRDDPRITKVGNVLRKTSINELPQLWDVVRGKMSLVGPRPWLRKEFEDLPPELQKRRAKFKPGITSIASLRGNRLTLVERAQLDIEFMKNLSLLGYYITILSTMKNKTSGIIKNSNEATFGKQ
jgi:lipopolysaccharide/colanic/teichoic acid biosynthesis glycosyltransferase